MQLKWPGGVEKDQINENKSIHLIDYNTLQQNYSNIKKKWKNAIKRLFESWWWIRWAYNIYPWSDEYRNTKEFCHVKENFPINKDTKKCVIMLPWIMQRDKYTIWEIPNIALWNEAVYSHFDYPKVEFNEDKVIKQIIDYIKNRWFNEIILCGLSFGEIVCRKVLEKLPIEERKKIKKHISINWVTTQNELAFTQRSLLNINKIISKKLLATFGVTIRWLSKFKPAKNKKFTKVDFDKSLWNEKIENIVKDALWLHKEPNNKQIDDFIIKRIAEENLHIRSTNLAITWWLHDRGKMISSQKEVWKIWADTIAIYCDNDWYFINPSESAKHISNKAKQAWYDWKIINVKWWDHARMIWKWQNYNPILREIIKF